MMQRRLSQDWWRREEKEQNINTWHGQYVEMQRTTTPGPYIETNKSVEKLKETKGKQKPSAIGRHIVIRHLCSSFAGLRGRKATGRPRAPQRTLTTIGREQSKKSKVCPLHLVFVSFSSLSLLSLSLCVCVCVCVCVSVLSSPGDCTRAGRRPARRPPPAARRPPPAPQPHHHAVTPTSKSARSTGSTQRRGAARHTRAAGHGKRHARPQPRRPPWYTRACAATTDCQRGKKKK